MEPENGLFVLGIAAFVFSITWLLIYLLEIIKSTRRHPITHTPITPNWLLFAHTHHLNSLSDRFKLHAVPRNLRRETENYAIEKVSKILTDPKIAWKLNLNLPVLPEHQSLTIQIPKRNFKCGDQINDFEPLSGKQEGEWYSYQMFGEQAIQATYYNVKDQKYLAGFVVYIPSPYHWGVRYPHWIFRRLAELPDFYPNAPESGAEGAEEDVKLSWCIIDLQPVIITKNRLGQVSRFQMGPEHFGLKQFNWCKETFMPDYPMAPSSFSRKLKVRMCKKSKEPVMVGMVDGRMCHVEWEEGKMKVVECDGCGGKDQDEEEEPPNYETWMSRWVEGN